jgi:hypothetical protein
MPTRLDGHARGPAPPARLAPRGTAPPARLQQTIMGDSPYDGAHDEAVPASAA